MQKRSASCHIIQTIHDEPARRSLSLDSPRTPRSHSQEFIQCDVEGSSPSPKQVRPHDSNHSWRRPRPRPRSPNRHFSDSEDDDFVYTRRGRPATLGDARKIYRSFISPVGSLSRSRCRSTSSRLGRSHRSHRSQYARAPSTSSASPSSLSSASDDDDEPVSSLDSRDPNPAWTSAIEDLKEQNRKRFHDAYRSFPISDSEWIRTFYDFRNNFYGTLQTRIKRCMNDRSKNADGMIQGIPKAVLYKALLGTIKALHPKYGRGMDLTGVMNMFTGAIYKGCMRSELGSEADSAQKWAGVVEDLRAELTSELEAQEHILPFLKPNVNVAEARRSLNIMGVSPAHVKARALRERGQDSFLITSQTCPEFFTLFHRIVQIHKGIDQVLYGMPIGEKSPAYLAGQDLDVFEYFKCDEVNLRWKEIFAVLDFNMRDKCQRGEFTESAHKAMQYYFIIAGLASAEEQSWLYQEIGNQRGSENDEYRNLERKWKTLQSFLHSAEPKARQVELSIQAVHAAEPDSVLRRRHVPGSRAVDERSERHIAHEEDVDDAKLNSIDPQEAPSIVFQVTTFTMHLLTSLRRVRQTPNCSAILTFLVDRKTLLVIFPCFIALSALFTGVSIVAFPSAPNTSNFYTQLSSFSQALFSLYCLTVPLVRTTKLDIWPLWLRLSLATSAICGILSVAFFFPYQQASIALCFVAGIAQIIATILLIEGIDQIGKHPSHAADAHLPSIHASTDHKDCAARASRRPCDDQAFELQAYGAVAEEQDLGVMSISTVIGDLLSQV